jgi:ribosomal-protein-alanine N-acetyltransferase
MELDIEIVSGTLKDLPFLQEMLFEAAYWRPDHQRPSLEAGLARPDLVYLLKGWGRQGDTAVIAITGDGQQAGAAWYRFWEPGVHSYGFVSLEIPELSIAVRQTFRGMNIGHRLINALLKTAVSQGIEKISLSVEVDNPAMNLYRDHGFQMVGKAGNSWTMVVKVCDSPNSLGLG